MSPTNCKEDDEISEEYWNVNKYIFDISQCLKVFVDRSPWLMKCGEAVFQTEEAREHEPDGGKVDESADDGHKHPCLWEQPDPVSIASIVHRVLSVAD